MNLGMKTPAAIHSFSTIPFLERILRFDYDANFKVKKVIYRNVFLGFFNENSIRDKQVLIRLSQNMV